MLTFFHFYFLHSICSCCLQKIVEAGEEAVQKYYNFVPNIAKTCSDVAMQVLHGGMQLKLVSYLNQFNKQLGIRQSSFDI